jgi:hypothetical protein
MPFPDHLIDPALMGLMATPGRAVSPVVSRGSTPIHWSPTPSPVKITVTVETPVKPAKENQDPGTQKPKVKVKKETPLSEAILRARQNVKKVPAKRSLEDALLSMHEYIF